eukprot:PhF_6_TR26252/c0_g1_i1/m.37543
MFFRSFCLHRPPPLPPSTSKKLSSTPPNNNKNLTPDSLTRTMQSYSTTYARTGILPEPYFTTLSQATKIQRSQWNPSYRVVFLSSAAFCYKCPKALFEHLVPAEDVKKKLFSPKEILRIVRAIVTMDYANTLLGHSHPLRESASQCLIETFEAYASISFENKIQLAKETRWLLAAILKHRMLNHNLDFFPFRSPYPLLNANIIKFALPHVSIHDGASMLYAAYKEGINLQQEAQELWTQCQQENNNSDGESKGPDFFVSAYLLFHCSKSISGEQLYPLLQSNIPTFELAHQALNKLHQHNVILQPPCDSLLIEHIVEIIQTGTSNPTPAVLTNFLSLLGNVVPAPGAGSPLASILLQVAATAEMNDVAIIAASGMRMGFHSSAAFLKEIENRCLQSTPASSLKDKSIGIQIVAQSLCKSGTYDPTNFVDKTVESLEAHFQNDANKKGASLSSRSRAMLLLLAHRCGYTGDKLLQLTTLAFQGSRPDVSNVKDAVTLQAVLYAHPEVTFPNHIIQSIRKFVLQLKPSHGTSVLLCYQSDVSPSSADMHGGLQNFEKFAALRWFVHLHIRYGIPPPKDEVLVHFLKNAFGDPFPSSVSTARVVADYLRSMGCSD